MTDEEVRALVREIVAERLAAVGYANVPTENRHASHLLLHVAPGAETGGPCLIEPGVRCNLCGYCQSLGH